jgi:hypothetical protein
MAIAFDTNSTLHQGTSSVTFSHTCTGSNLILFVASHSSTTTSGVTYNGAAMTKITQKTLGSGAELSLWYLIAPSTGAHNVVATGSGGAPTVSAWSASYTGVQQRSQPDASGVAGPTTSTSFSQSLTSVADNCWAIWAGFTASGSTDTAGSNTVLRVQDIALVGLFLADTGAAKTPAGTDTMNMTASASVTWETIMATFVPFSVKAANLTESATITDKLSRLPSRTLTDSFSLTDTFFRNITKVLSENLTLSNVLTFLHSRFLILTETFSLLDTMMFKTIKNLFSPRSTSFSDKFTSRGNSATDKFSKQNTSFSDKFSSR